MNQECQTCNTGNFGMNGEMGVCQAHPPTSHTVLLPEGQVQMTLRPTPMSSLPSVGRTHWCREWQAKDSIIDLGGH